MSFINYAAREINVKIVFYGPGLGGKTTNLQYIYEKTNPNAKGKLISLATETDRTLFFDFLPLELGEVKGFKTRFHLYTVPGQVFYDASRKLILKGVDGVVFVADSSTCENDGAACPVDSVTEPAIPAWGTLTASFPTLAIDSTAGEKERRSLEPLLLNPPKIRLFQIHVAIPAPSMMRSPSSVSKLFRWTRPLWTSHRAVTGRPAAASNGWSAAAIVFWCTKVAGSVVTTTANVVTTLGTDGFFIQTPTARTDGNVYTSDGIFVYTGGAPAVMLDGPIRYSATLFNEK